MPTLADREDWDESSASQEEFGGWDEDWDEEHDWQFDYDWLDDWEDRAEETGAASSCARAPAALLRLPLPSLWLPASCPLASINSAAASPRLPLLPAASPAAQGR